MTLVRTAGVLLLSALVASLAGCALTPPAGGAGQEESYAGLDRVAVDALLREALPGGIGEGVTVEEGDPFDMSLVVEGSIADHDAHRVAGVYRVYSSPGWFEADAGPVYQLMVDTFLMDTPGAAATYMEEISIGAGEGYALALPTGNTLEYLPASQAPRPFLPEGSVERNTIETWPTGETAPGWVAWTSVGAVLVIVTGMTGPDEESRAALEEVGAAHLTGFFERLRELPAELERLR